MYLYRTFIQPETIINALTCKLQNFKEIEKPIEKKGNFQ